MQWHEDVSSGAFVMRSVERPQRHDACQGSFHSLKSSVTVEPYMLSAYSSRPISMRRISLVPAPIS